MINSSEILQTIHMFDQQHLDIRTITMGISLLDCADPDPAGHKTWWPPARPLKRSLASPLSTSGCR